MHLTFTALLAPTTAAHAVSPTQVALRHAPGDTITLPVRDALAALTVQGEGRTGYERTKFRHWTNADRGLHAHRRILVLAV